MKRLRTLPACLALCLGLALPALSARAGAETPGTRIPVKRIPKKDIPKTVRYLQAPAYDAQQRRNRALVRNAMQSGRRLKRGGTAYETLAR